MPFISVSGRRKRERSSWIRFPSRRKVRVLEQGNFDGAASTSDRIKARFSGQSSRVMSLLGIAKEGCEDRGSRKQSNADTQCSERETSSTIIKYQGFPIRRQSSSLPGLTHRLSHKVSSTFGHPTVVHRTSLRSRPSVRSLQEAVEATQLERLVTHPGVSATSTWNSGSGSSPAQLSTNPTSDGLGSSPIRSTGRNVPFAETTKCLILSREASASKLAAISETLDVVVPSIITVEATAAAKIFFETHFKHIVSSHKPRSQRRRDLERALEICNWSLTKRHRARLQYIREENEFLRQNRVLKSGTNKTKKANHLSIAGYEIVKVLGKGSFGVVRLVKEKTEPHVETTPILSPLPAKKPSKTDMASLKSTARGAFPLLASRRKSLTKIKKGVYAMKVIRKSEMLRNSQEGHLRAERDFLVASENSRWVVPLIAAFQDNKNLYLVMDYCVGGDFLGLLIRKNTLSEDVTRWYIAEMILCVEEAHCLRWIHRDVKPDNFLIGGDGHLKISDFGLAFDGSWMHDQSFFHNHRHSLMEKLGIELCGDDRDRSETESANASRNIAKVAAGGEPAAEKKQKPIPEPAEDEPIVDWREKNQRRKLARSVVGTSQYMAPEVIRGELYDGRCDWWSIGIILYECLFGFTPFACEGRQETKLKILTHKNTLAFPDERYGFPSISGSVLDLMRRILREKEERLSSPKYHLNDYAYTQGEDCNTYHIHGPANKSSKNYQGRHVYADDADDIKAHHWFKSINWSQIHRKKPPFVPKIKDWEDTRYFDDEESISDMVSSSSEEMDEISPALNKENGLDDGRLGEDPYAFETAGTAATNMKHGLSGHQQEAQHIIPSNLTTMNTLFSIPRQKDFDPIVGGAHNPDIPSDIHLHPSYGKEDPHHGNPLKCGPTEGAKPQKPQKEKKRPRDKILRDPSTAKIALNIRRKGAFLGYGYKRPKNVENLLERVEDELVAEQSERIVVSGHALREQTKQSRLDDNDVDDDGRRDSAIAGVETKFDPAHRRDSVIVGAVRNTAPTKGREVELDLSSRNRDGDGGGDGGAPSPANVTSPKREGLSLQSGLGIGGRSLSRFGFM